MTGRQYNLWLKGMKFGKACGCHQLPERSFRIKSIQFPFCARCTGLIIGEFVFAPILFFIFGFQSIVLSIAFIAIMSIDGLLQYYKIIMSTNFRRIVTGILAGIGYMILTIRLLLYIFSLTF